MKGQWFIISSVFVAFSLLAVSADFRSFGVIDSSEIAGYTEGYYFDNLKGGLQKTVEISDNTCEDMARNLDDFIYFSQQSIGKMGYVADVFYEIKDCRTKEVVFNLISVQSEKFQIWEGIRPEIGAV